MDKFILIYFLVINFFGYFMMMIDKKRARENKWRIPERRLLLCAFFGGSIGSLIGMMKFHHKTKHPKFYIGIPAMLIFQIEMAVIYFVCIMKMNTLS